MGKLVRLWKRPCKRGREFKYVLIWYDEQGKERWKALGHADAKKAERQRAQKERELWMGLVQPGSMKLSEFLEDSLRRTQGQVREGTLSEYGSAMRHFINIVGDVDYRRIQYQHGERFIQECLDGGNRPATVAKKIGTLKRLFQLAVQRQQLEENPFRYVAKPKAGPRDIHVFSDEECVRMVKAARALCARFRVAWDILIQTALCTGMRRGELLNTIWPDVDFGEEIIRVSPKEDTEFTWEWHIKDTERRSVPLTEEVIQLLAEHQASQPEGYPYVFVPPHRYDYAQTARLQGRWKLAHRRCPLSNFRYQFRVIMARAGIDEGMFHDIRRTCITNWFANGLSEFDVMTMAGHSSFSTTHKFYLAVRKDLIGRARKASSEAMKSISIANSLQVPFSHSAGEGTQFVSD